MATKRTRRKVLRGLQDIYDYCQLEGIRYRHLNVREARNESEPGTATLTASYDMADDDEVLVVTFGVKLRTDLFTYDVAVMAAYRGRGRFRVEEQTVDDFINGSSLLTLFPFLRQGVIDLATKVHESPIPVLPLAGPGIGQRLVLMDEE